MDLSYFLSLDFVNFFLFVSIFSFFMIVSVIFSKEIINDDSFLVDGNIALLFAFSQLFFLFLVINLSNFFYRFLEYSVAPLPIYFFGFVVSVILNFFIINKFLKNKKVSISYALDPVLISVILFFIFIIIMSFCQGIGGRPDFSSLILPSIMMFLFILWMDFFSISFISKKMKNWKILSYFIIFFSEFIIIYFVGILIVSFR